MMATKGGDGGSLVGEELELELEPAAPAEGDGPVAGQGRRGNL